MCCARALLSARCPGDSDTAQLLPWLHVARKRFPVMWELCWLLPEAPSQCGLRLCPCPHRWHPGALVSGVRVMSTPKVGTCGTSTGWFVPQAVWTRSPPPAEASLNLCCQGKVRAKPVKAEPLAGPWAGASLPFYILKWSLGTFSFASMLKLLAVTQGKV